MHIKVPTDTLMDEWAFRKASANPDRPRPAQTGPDFQTTRERRPKTPTQIRAKKNPEKPLNDERLHETSASMERKKDLNQGWQAGPASGLMTSPIDKAFRARLRRTDTENSLHSSLMLQVASCFFRSVLLIDCLSRLSHQIWPWVKLKPSNVQKSKIMASSEQPEEVSWKFNEFKEQK